MASVEQARAALESLAASMAGVDASTRRAKSPEGTLSCTVRDLGVIFRATLTQGELSAVEDVTSADARYRFTVNSDDLVALADGTVSIGALVASGRLTLRAGPLDLLRLRSLL